MKKWIIIGILLLVCATGMQYRPMNLRDRIERSVKDTLEVRIANTTITGETSSINESKTYKMATEDKEYEEVMRILEGYTYHRSVYRDSSHIMYHPGMVGEVIGPSIGVGDLHLTEDFCIIGELHCAIGYTKGEEEKLKHEIVSFLESANLDYLYRKVTIENNEIVDDYSKKYWVDYGK